MKEISFGHTVEELKSILKDIPDNTDVVTADYDMLNIVYLEDERILMIDRSYNMEEMLNQFYPAWEVWVESCTYVYPNGESMFFPEIYLGTYRAKNFTEACMIAVSKVSYGLTFGYDWYKRTCSIALPVGERKLVMTEGEAASNSNVIRVNV